jgi:mono/diheme cytochrome c family protein
VLKSLLLILAATMVSVASDDGRISRSDAQKLKSPVPYTKKSIDRGKLVFLQNCTGCHGTDGKAEMALIAEATDLTTVKQYKNGVTEGEIFRSIRDGAGDQMPPFKSQLDKEEDLWHLVNFIHSLWPESARPQLQDK